MQPRKSPLLDFYRLIGHDSEGRTLPEIWAWDDHRLEHVHDFIQWMFPLDEPSSVNADAPLVTREDRGAFESDLQLQSAMRRSFSVFLNFLGLAMNDDGRVVRGQDFAERSAIWKYSNHNWLRITRVIKSLRLLGFEKEAAAFWTCLKDLHENQRFVGETSFKYWAEAAKGLLEVY
jgi:hypothetical protein